MAMQAFLAGRPEDSIQQFDFAMKFDPRYYPALNERAYALITQYDKGLQLDDTLRAKAVDAWQQSLKLYPDQPNVQAALNQWNNQQFVRQAELVTAKARGPAVGLISNARLPADPPRRRRHLSPSTNQPGLATIPGRGESDSVLEQLARELNLPCTGKTDPRLRVVHRLDKETSGVLLFAKHLDAQRHLSHQFQNNTIEKEYLAIVISRPQTENGEIDAPLAPHPTSPKRMAVSKQGRPARTLWQTEARYRDFTLLRVFPKPVRRIRFACTWRASVCRWRLIRFTTCRATAHHRGFY